MSPVMALALLAVAGLLATRLPHPPSPRSAPLRLVVRGGAPLLVLGLALGPGIAVLDRPTLAALAPVIALAVGWLAAAFGAHVEWRLVRRLNRRRAAALAAPALAAAALVVIAAWLATRVVPDSIPAGRLRWPVITTLGALAAVSGPDAVALLARVTGLPGRAARPLGRAATLETAIATLLVALLWVVFQARAAAGGALAGAIGGFTLTLGSGALAALVFFALTRPSGLEAPPPFALVAAVLVGAGLGWAAGGSPFVVCAIGGTLIANGSSERRAVQAVLRQWTPAFSTVLLVIAGALIAAPAWRLPAVIGLLAAVRVGAKWAATRTTSALAPAASLPPNGGLALVVQGGIALALAVNFFLIYDSGADPSGARALVGAAVLGIVIAQAIATPLVSLALAGSARVRPGSQAG